MSARSRTLRETSEQSLETRPSEWSRGAGMTSLDDLGLLHRLVLATQALGPAFVALVNRGGRPPIDTPEEALKSPHRQKIMQLVRERPGITQQDLAPKLRLGPTALNAHVLRLREVGLLEARQWGRSLQLYPAGEAPAEDDPAVVPPLSRRIGLLMLRGTWSSSEIAAATGYTDRNVRVHLRALADAHLIEEVPGEKYRRYVATERLREAAKAWRAQR